MSIRCLQCHGDTKVINSRGVPGNVIKRRRICLECGFRWTTLEIGDPAKPARKQPPCRVCGEPGYHRYRHECIEALKRTLRNVRASIERKAAA